MRMDEPVRTQPPYHAPIAFDGWTGRVLTQRCPSNVTDNKIEAPSAQTWREWLGMLVSRGTAMHGCKILKTSDSVHVIQTHLPGDGPSPGLAVVGKQSCSHSLLDTLRPSPARRNFDRGLRLRAAGIATALPLAYLECRSPRGSWLITEYLDRVVDLDSFVLTILTRSDSSLTHARRSDFVKSIAALFRGLELAGLYHRDMKASNILLTLDSKGGAPRACIVDLDGLSPRRPWRSRWRPLTRLAASLFQYRMVNATDYARFLKSYLTAGGEDVSQWKTNFQRLRKEAARYSQAAQKRKRNKLDGYG